MSIGFFIYGTISIIAFSILFAWAALASQEAIREEAERWRR